MTGRTEEKDVMVKVVVRTTESQFMELKECPSDRNLTNLYKSNKSVYDGFLAKRRLQSKFRFIE